MHVGKKTKNKVLSALMLYDAGQGGLSHLCVQGPDKKGQVLQVLKWVPIR